MELKDCSIGDTVTLEYIGKQKFIVINKGMNVILYSFNQKKLFRTLYCNSSISRALLIEKTGLFTPFKHLQALPFLDPYQIKLDSIRIQMQDIVDRKKV